MKATNTPKRSPFKFLDSYEQQDGPRFFGREEEVEELYKAVDNNEIVLLYGGSGVGKTSLIKAGLANRYQDEEWHPVFISRGQDINQSVFANLIEKIPLGDSREESFDNLTAQLFRYYQRPVYLILEQFEELFVSGDLQEQELFAFGLRELLKANIPCKMIIVMREEFLGHLYNLEKMVPSLFNARMRLEPMSRARLGEVIVALCRQNNIELEDGVADQILDNCTGLDNQMSLPMLQIYLDRLYRQENIGEGSVHFSMETVEKLGDISDVLKNYLFDKVANIENEMTKLSATYPPGLVSRILENFITENDTRARLDYDFFLRRLPEFPSEFFIPILDRLNEARIIRKLLEGDNYIYELSHDSLVEIISESKSDERRRIEDILKKVRFYYKDFQDTGEFISRQQIRSIQPYLDKIGPFLSTEENDFIVTSIDKHVGKEEQNLKSSQRPSFFKTIGNFFRDIYKIDDEA